MRPVISKRPRRPCFSDRAILPGGGRTPAPAPSQNLVQARLGRVRGLGAQMAMCGDFPRVHRKVAATQIAGFERVG